MKQTKTISPEQARQMMDAGDVYVLDVREPSEFASGRVPGAHNLPVGKLRRTSDLPDLDTTVLVYCLSGVRSATACAILSEMGYQNVYNFGGIAQWPYEIED